jgi:hypothetical protein
MDCAEVGKSQRGEFAFQAGLDVGAERLYGTGSVAAEEGFGQCRVVLMQLGGVLPRAGGDRGFVWV